MYTTPQLLIGAASALGGGLLIGLERERRKGQGPGRAPAGIRTFGLAALAGFGARALEEPYLVAAGTLFLVVVAGIAAWRDRSSDPGITTELALLVTYLLGSLAIDRPLEAAGAAVVVTSLLIGRRPLHAFSVDVLTATELRDGLLFAAAALILLPLLPDRGFDGWPGFNPHRLWTLVVLFMALQAAGYIATRAAGADLGLALSGFATGFASSTGTIAALGVRARQDPALRASCIAGALGSTVSTVVLLGVFAVTISPATFERMLLPLAAGVVTALAIVAFMLWHARGRGGGSELAGRAFNLPYAIGFAALLSAVTAIVAYTSGHLGNVAATGATALAAVFDVHAAAASVFTLAASGAITPQGAVMPVLIAWSVNALTKIVAAFTTGGIRYGAAVAAGVGGSLGAAWAAWAFVPR